MLLNRNRKLFIISYVFRKVTNLTDGFIYNLPQNFLAV